MSASSPTGKQREKYGMAWAEEDTDLAIEIAMIRRGGQWKGANGQTFGKGLLYHHTKLQKELWPDKIWHRWNELLLEHFCAKRFIGIVGPASCVAGHTKILNPWTGKSESIESLCEKRERVWVMTLEGPVLATAPFVKGFDALYEVEMKSGRKFTATSEHRVYTTDGFRSVSAIREGCTILAYDESHQPSTLEPFQSAPISNAHRSKKKAEGFQSDYLLCPYSCDEQPRLHATVGQCGLPSQIGVLTHNSYFAFDRDSQAYKSERTRLYQSPFHRAIEQRMALSYYTENLASHFGESGTPSPSFGSFQYAWQSESGNNRPCLIEEPTKDSCRTHQNHVQPCPNYRVQLDTVASIKFVGRSLFYDLCVPNVHHYFADGAIHHNSGKTFEAACWAVANYVCYPNEITIIVSSTDMTMLEYRIWGEIKRQWNKAKKIHSTLPGHILNNSKAIVTDNIRESEWAFRDHRNGIICRPSVSGMELQSLAKFVGAKNARVMQIADELQFMQGGFIDAISNLSKNPNHQCIGMGNPKDRFDVLGKLCEPSKETGGWEGYEPKDTTHMWDTAWPNGVCVNLVGIDSPNFDVPEDAPVPYPFLITRRSIAQDLERCGKESWQFEMFNMGIFPKVSSANRILSRALCEQRKALELPNWNDEPLTKFASLDAAYGSVGGDRCVLIEWAMGKDETGRKLLAMIGQPILVPVSVRKNAMPEDQIALFVMRECLARGIPPEQLGFDSTGRGSLVSAFARLWSPYVAGIEFGGPPSDRIVSRENKTECRKYYYNFMSELWFQFRLAVESEQIRGLTLNVIAEAELRAWEVITGGKVKVEPKELCKKRMGRSPDLMDSAVCGLEIARRHGFEIEHLNAKAQKQNMDWLYSLKTRHREVMRAATLTY